MARRTRTEAGTSRAKAAKTKPRPNADKGSAVTVAKRRSSVRPSAAASAAEQKGLNERLHSVRFFALENVAYHAMREQFLARVAKVLTGAQVLLGTSAVGMLSDAIPGSPMGVVVTAALVGVLLLVLDPAAGAREHRILRGKYLDVVAELDGKDANDADIREMRSAMVRISAGEPPAYRAVQAMAYNTAVLAIYSRDEAPQYLYRIGAIRRLLAHVFPMRGAQFGK